MNGFFKTVRLLLLGALILGQAGCATSDADLGYTPHAADGKMDGSQSHGWGAQ